MSGSVVAPLASLPMARVAPASVDAARAPSATEAASQQPHDAGPRWQRARLVLDQHQRDRDAATKPGQVLPVIAELADLLPQHGLRRGSTVVVRGSTTLLLALLAEPTTAGSWAAIVGMPDLGLVAAAELGVAVQRLALIPHPGNNIADVVAALLDGMDLVAVVPNTLHTRSAATLARRLSARARHRKSVLIATGEWPGADLELTCTNTTWSGLGNGNGHLTTRETTIKVHGRGTASRPATHRRTFPATPTPLHRPHTPKPQLTPPSNLPAQATPPHTPPTQVAEVAQVRTPAARAAEAISTRTTPAQVAPAHTAAARTAEVAPPRTPVARVTPTRTPSARIALTAATRSSASVGSPPLAGRLGLAPSVNSVVQPGPPTCPPSSIDSVGQIRRPDSAGLVAPVDAAGVADRFANSGNPSPVADHSSLGAG